jgi:hypothetical protein
MSTLIVNFNSNTVVKVSAQALEVIVELVDVEFDSIQLEPEARVDTATEGHKLERLLAVVYTIDQRIHLNL